MMADSFTVVGWVLFLTFDLLVITRLLSKRQSLSLPPGPPRKPIIGNLLDWPKEKDWEVFSRWHQVYGMKVFL